jgi:toluene monooxygenase system protein E
MAAAYAAHMAPSGRIVIAAAFQAADELRRVQRLAYRMGQLRRRRPGFGDASLAAWEEGAPWQPLRELLERLLVVRDWGESLVALDLVVKPVLDRLWLDAIGDCAVRRGDPLLARLLGSLGEDARWHRAWARELARIAIEDDPSSREAIAEWTAAWLPRTESAARELAPLLEAPGEAPWLEAALARIRSEVEDDPRLEA